MKFAHIADVHLGKKIDVYSSWAKEAEREVYDGFVAFIDEMQLQPVDFIFITGDLFDHVPTTEDLHWVDSQFVKLNNTNIIYITGEKDYLEKNCPLFTYHFMSNVYLLNGEEFHNHVKEEEKAERNSYAEGVFDCIYFPKFNLDIYGACFYNHFSERNDFDTIYAHNTKRLNILLGHGGEEHVCPFDIEDLRGGYFQYMGFGHKHNFESDKEKKFCYAGSLIPLSPEETGEHGYVRGYMDEFVSSYKLVPLHIREYKNIEVQAKNITSNAELLRELEDMLKKNKHAIFSIKIVRDDDCYTDFDLSVLRKKYRILSVEGEKTFSLDVLKLQDLNKNNDLGKTIKQILENDDEVKNRAVAEYVKKISELVFLGKAPDDIAYSVKDEEIKQANQDIEKDCMEEFVTISQGLEVCNRELMKNLSMQKKYPDHTGDMNTLRGKKNAEQYELDKIVFEEKSIMKNYKTKRLKVVIIGATPFVLLLSYWLTCGIFIIIIKDEWAYWLKLIVSLLASSILFGFLGKVLYDKTKKLRKKIFGTKIPEEERIRLKNLIDSREKQMDAIDAKMEGLLLDQKKYEKLKEEEKELVKRKKRLMEKGEVLQVIVNGLQEVKE